MTRNPTPKQAKEWMLSGATPEEAIRSLEYEIQHYDDQIRRKQIKVATARHCLKELKAGNWPVNDEGFLTLSEDNPLSK